MASLTWAVMALAIALRDLRPPGLYQIGTWLSAPITCSRSKLRSTPRLSGNRAIRTLNLSS